MTGNHSVFFFNVGIHYSLVLNFTTYRRLIQSLITLLKRDSLGSKALQIWRSSTAIEREHLKKLYAGDNLTKWRFHTSPVVSIFSFTKCFKKVGWEFKFPLNIGHFRSSCTEKEGDKKNCIKIFILPSCLLNFEDSKLNVRAAKS